MASSEKKNLLCLKVELRRLLKVRGTTVAHLSRLSGISRRTLNDWLAGSAPRNISDLKKVATLMDTTVDALCFGGEVDVERDRVTELEALLGDGWVGGLFEVRFRRVKK